MKKFYTVLAAALAVALSASAVSPLRSVSKSSSKLNFAPKTELNAVLRADDNKSQIRRAAAKATATGATVEDVALDYVCSAYSQATNPETQKPYGWDNFGLTSIYATTTENSVILEGFLGTGSGECTGTFDPATGTLTVPGKQVIKTLTATGNTLPNGEPEYTDIYIKFFVSRVNFSAATLADQLVEGDEPIVFKYDAENHSLNWECEVAANKIVTLLVMEFVNADGSPVPTQTSTKSFVDMLAMVDLDGVNGTMQFEAPDFDASTDDKLEWASQEAFVYGEVTADKKFQIKNIYDYGFGVKVDFDIDGATKSLSAMDVLLATLSNNGSPVDFYLTAVNPTTGQLDENLPITFQGSVETIGEGTSAAEITLFTSDQSLTDYDTSYSYRLGWEMMQNTQMLFFSNIFESAGVESVTIADENAPVEYFNLQGVRVAKPESGLYIKRQGNTAVKVLVK